MPASPVHDRLPNRLDRLSDAIPRLEPGDCLTRHEFERRYWNMPYLKGAELIEGRVCIPSPVRFIHGKAVLNLIGWLGIYKAHTDHVLAAAHASLRIDDENEFQPDVVMLLDPKRGGQAVICEDDFLAGTPEFIAEVAYSSASIELHDKLRVYHRLGVPEYLVWRVDDNAIDWFCFERSDYARMEPDSTGLLRSRVFPGLWLAPSAMLTDDYESVLRTIEAGIAANSDSAV